MKIDLHSLPRGWPLLPAILLAVAFGFPRFIATAGFAILLATAWTSTKNWRTSLAFESPTLALCALGIWAMLSGLWSPDAGMSIQSGAILVALALLTDIAARRLASMSDDDDVRSMAFLVAIVALAGTVFLAAEALSARAVSKAVIAIKNAILSAGAVVVSEGENNRRTTLVALLWLPSMLVIYSVAPAQRRATFLSIGGLALIPILLFTTHQSSQAALLVGAVAGGLASISTRWTARLMAAAWLAACLLMAPLAHLAFKAELHKAPWLFSTARHRIVIWSYMTDRIVEHPLLGVGAQGARVLHETVDRDRLIAYQRNAGTGASTAPHGHNFFLQAWYDLGLVGAAALAAFGVAVIMRIRWLPEFAQPFALAQFAIFAGLIAFSFGLWQPWFQTILGLQGLMMLFALYALPHSQAVEAERPA